MLRVSTSVVSMVILVTVVAVVTVVTGFDFKVLSPTSQIRRQCFNDL
jgi:hypothetical protein